MSEVQVIATELERVLPMLPVLFEREATFFSTIEKRPAEVVSGRDMRIPLEIRPGGSFGYVDIDGGDLGRGSMGDFDKAIISVVNPKHAVEMTTKTIWATDSPKKAIVNQFRRQLADGMKEFRRHVNAQCVSDGTGVIGTVTTITPVGAVDTITMTTDGFGAKLVRTKQRVQIVNSTMTVNRTPTPVTVTYVDIPSKTIKVTPNVVGIVAGDLIIPEGLTVPNPQAILGVKYHSSNASTGTWLGFDRALFPEIRANGTDALSSSLTLPLPRLAMNKVGDRIGEDNMKKVTAWMHPAQKAAIEEMGWQIIRIDKSSKGGDLDLYFNDNMRIAGAPVKTTFAWDRTRIDFIDTDNWGRAEMHPVSFYKNPDSDQRLFEIRGPSGGVATSWIFYIVASFNLFVKNPAAVSYISGLAVPAGY